MELKKAALLLAAMSIVGCAPLTESSSEQDAIESTLNRFAEAVAAQDAAAIQNSFSLSAVSRISAYYGSVDSGIQRRLASERAALLKAREEGTSAEMFKVLAVLPGASDDEVSVSVTFAGVDIGKSIQLVRQNGEYKIEGVGPSFDPGDTKTAASCTSSWKDFRIWNRMGVEVNVSCDMRGDFTCSNAKNMLPGESSTLNCPSYCGWVGGSRFSAVVQLKYMAVPWSCAYNLFGTDVTIKDGDGSGTTPIVWCTNDC